MKKILIFLLTGIYFLFNFSFAVAIDSGEIAGELPFEVSRCKVEALSDSNAMVSFEITNKSDIYYSKLYYEPYLILFLDEGDNLWYPVPYLSFNPVEFELGANEEKKIVYNFELPENLIKGKYEIEFVFYEKASRLSGDTVSILLGELGKERGFLNFIEEAYWRIEDKEVMADSGPNINENTDITAVIPVKSSYSSTKRFIPQIRIYERIRAFNSKPIMEFNGSPVEIKAGEVKDIEIILPKIGKPESYLILINMVDENLKISSCEYKFRYVVEGVTANILSVYAVTKEDLSTDVNLRIIGPADFSNIEGTVKVELYAESGNLLARKNEEMELNQFASDININLGKININENSKVKVISKIYHNNIEIASDERSLVMRKTDSNNVKDLTDVMGTKYEEAAIGLNAMGIISGYPDSTYRPEANITRAEVTAIICKIGKFDTTLKEDFKFNDVVPEHWAKNYIATAYNNGIISGYPDGTFKPSNNVKYSEVVTMLLNLLGERENVLDSPLNWPDNYLVKAMEKGITKEVNIEDYNLSATRGDVALMVWQAYRIKQ